MASRTTPSRRTLRILAQDPQFCDKHGQPVTAFIEIPAEELDPGPRGYRVSVVDLDQSAGTFTSTRIGPIESKPFAKSAPRTLVEDRDFHAQNVYAIVMRTLARFEFALGRRVPWGFYGHQLQVVPHAMPEDNAYYSESAHAILFGYFPSMRTGKPVYTCLSHDIVAHETTHAILDGLKDFYTDAALPDQAAFHEGFADIVALLSVFSIDEAMAAAVERPHKGLDRKESLLFSIGEEMGRESSPSALRARALRRSLELRPSKNILKTAAYEEEHDRGEVLVYAVVRAFLEIWKARSAPFERRGTGNVARIREEAAEAADNLLTMAVRALDYCPPLDLTFGDYLSAMLTADAELVPGPGKYHYREKLRETFGRWGIKPASNDGTEGTWAPPLPKERGLLKMDLVHFESLRRDPDEVFRFLWENRKVLGVFEDAYTRVICVRPCTRVGLDGFVLHETVAEYYQLIECEARDLPRMKGFRLKLPKGMPPEQKVSLRGGGTLIFDEFGHLKYHVRKRIDNVSRQEEKLKYFWMNGLVDRTGRLGVGRPDSRGQRFANTHRLRFTGLGEW